jgi:hypothetical protein
MKKFNLLKISVVSLLLAVLLGGCAPPPGGHLWGEDVTLAPGWSRLAKAAADAALGILGRRLGPPGIRLGR